MTDINALFDKNPLEYTKTDIDEIISYMREARTRFNQGVKSAGSEKAAKPPKEVKALDLSALGLIPKVGGPLT